MTVTVVGASDGKFVLPLALRGYRVVAIELDQTALFGGPIESPDGSENQSLGLVERLRLEGLQEVVTVVAEDFLQSPPPASQSDAIFTSCSWHYSRNHWRPLASFVQKMQQRVKPGGIFCSEYMMPVEQKHDKIEHYPKEGQIEAMFGEGWTVLEQFYTTNFLEKGHAHNLQDHYHRMGFMLATRNQG